MQNHNPSDDATIQSLGFEFVKERDGISQYTLAKNGLKVLLVPQPTSMAATVMMVYHVGSRNEAVGFTGSTHFLEHMMFKGTDRFPSFDAVLTPLGADYNATTSYDRTNYFAKVPSEHVGVVIALEADRMRNLNLRQGDRDSEMTVVRNEFENGKNSPFSVLIEELGAVAFLAHPYHHPIIGWLSDVEGVPLERLKAFYDQFYWPDNATLMVTGNYGTTAEVLAIVAKEYGDIPRAPHPIPPVYTTESEQLGERRFIIERESTQNPIVLMGYRVPGVAHADHAALTVAQLLLGSTAKPASRLYKGLIESRLAVETFAWANNLKDEYLLRTGAVVANGATAAQCEAAVRAELERLASQPASDEELARVKAAARKSAKLSTDSQMALLSKLCEAEATADWEHFLDFGARLDAVTAQDVQDVARRYFTSRRLTVGTFVPLAPATTGDEAADSEAPQTAQPDATATAPESANRGIVGDLVEDRRDDGMTVQLLPIAGASTVAVSVRLNAGDSHAPADKPLVPTLVAMMLTRGAKHLDIGQLAAMLEEMGTSLSFNTDKASTYVAAKVVREDFDAFVKILADCIKNPLFPAEELAKAKEQLRANLSQMMSDTESLADIAMAQTAFAEGSFYWEQDLKDVVASLDEITVEDLKAFHAARIGPVGTILTITGDFDKAQADAAIGHAFRKWRPATEDNTISVSPVVPRDKAEQVRVHVPAQSSVAIQVGLPLAAKIGTKEYFVAKLANDALGENTLSARLGLVVREKHGLTYGITSRFDNAQHGNGTWRVGLTVNPTNVEKALALVTEVIETYRKEGIGEDELAGWKQNVVGGFQISLDNPLAIARQLNSYTFYGLPASYIDDLAVGYRAVTREEVNQYIRDNFDPSKMITVLVGTLK